MVSPHDGEKAGNPADRDADHWVAANPRLREIASLLTIAARDLVHDVGPGEDSTSVDTVSLLGCDVYTAVQTDHHTDDGFPRWTVLLILRSAGHSITLDDGATTICPQVGDLILFDLHREHCLDLPPEAFPADEALWLEPEHMRILCRDFVFVCAHADLDTRPSRAEAEQHLTDLLRPAVAACQVTAPR